MGTPAAYAWLPSSARLVAIDGYGTIPRGTLPVPTQPLSWPEKDPTETLDYVVDISEAVAGNEGDVIATLDATISPNNPGDLTLQSSCADGMQAILWLTAGFSGTIYTVTVTIGTNSGRVIARSITLPVQTLALQPNEPQDLLTNLDQPIDDQSGDPIETTT